MAADPDLAVTIPSSAATPVLVGHTAALEAFTQAYDSGRMPHAWLFTGRAGIGKATLAWHGAHYVLSDGRNGPREVDLETPAARLVAAESHPDLIVLRRPMDEKTGLPRDTLPVEEARKLTPFLSKTATRGGWRVALIEEAESLNRTGQNALLKVIEEPPPKTLILLTAPSVGTLLTTIRSRCRVMPLGPLPPEDVRQALERLGAWPTDAREGQRLVELARGSPGFALRLRASGIVPLYEDIVAWLAAGSRGDGGTLHALADRVSRKADSRAFGLITALIVDMLRCAARAAVLGGGPGGAGTSAADAHALPAFAARLAASVPAGHLVDLAERIARLFAEADTVHLDRKTVLLNVLGLLKREAGA